jgi:hypothetical protein
MMVVVEVLRLIPSTAVVTVRQLIALDVEIIAEPQPFVLV